MEWRKKWFGHVKQMEEGKMTKRVYVSEIEGGSVRGRPPVKWRDRVQEYVREKGERSLRSLEQARGEFQDRERWKIAFSNIKWIFSLTCFLY